MIRSHARSILGVAAVGAAALKFVATAAAAGMIWIHLCGSYTQGSGSTGGTLGVARSWTSNPGVTTPFGCPPNSAGTNPYGMEVFGGRSSVPAGARAHWEIDAPGGLVIVGVHTEGSGMVSYGVNQNMGWGGGFYWQGGGAQAYPAEVGYSSPPLFSSYFGWQIICGWSTCNGGTKPGEISILGLEIEAAEGSGPTVAVAPGSLGAASGWVRGVWTIAFSADGPTGACQLSASLGGASVSQPLNEPQSQITWHQCPAGSFSQSFNTAAVASGAGVPLVMWARDAAYDYSAGHYLSSAVTSNVNIDNDPVGVSLSGPTDAPSTAGTQYVTATGSAGPAGVSGIGCSVDGSPSQWYPQASVQVPVAGVGVHRVTCYSANNCPGRVGECRDVSAAVVDAEHPPADGGRDRLREARRLAAVPAGDQAGEGACPLGHGSATPSAGARQTASSHEGRAGDALPRSGCTPTGCGVGDRAAARQAGAREAPPLDPGPAAASCRDAQHQAGRAR